MAKVQGGETWWWVQLECLSTGGNETVFSAKIATLRGQVKTCLGRVSVGKLRVGVVEIEDDICTKDDDDGKMDPKGIRD